jgi:hypothetical protein
MLRPTTRHVALVGLLTVALAGCADGILDLSGMFGGSGGYGSGGYGSPTLASCTPSGTLDLGEPVDGRLEQGDCEQPHGGHVDHWRFTLDDPRDVRIDLTSEDFDPLVELWDEHGYMVQMDDDSGEGLNARIMTHLPSGTFTVVVRGYAPHARGAYRLTVQGPSPCVSRGEIVLGEAIGGAVGLDACLLDWWAVADSFGLTLPDERTVQFEVKASAGHPRLIVRDRAGFDVVDAWDEGGFGRIRARTTLGAGPYAVYVVRDAHGPELVYSLRVDEIDCGEPEPLLLGEPAKGALEHTDCTRANRAYRDAWTFELDAEEVVRIDLHADAFDPLLVLLDESGAEVAVDDDGGPGLNARIERALVPGVYVVLATSFRAGEVGAYTLTAAPAPAGGSGSAASGASPATPSRGVIP